MSEKIPPELSSRETELQDAAQVVLELCGELLPEEPTEVTHYGLASWKSIRWSSIDAVDIRNRLRASSLVDLTLRDGGTLSIDNPDGKKKVPEPEERLRERLLGPPTDKDKESWSEDANRMGMPELNLFAGPDSLSMAGVQADRKGQQETRLSIVLKYENEEHEALELITVTVSSYPEHPLFVQLDGDITSPSYYGGMDYRGHSPAYRTGGHDKQPDEILMLVSLARQLLDNPLES